MRIDCLTKLTVRCLNSFHRSFNVYHNNTSMNFSRNNNKCEAYLENRQNDMILNFFHQRCFLTARQ